MVAEVGLSLRLPVTAAGAVGTSLAALAERPALRDFPILEKEFLLAFVVELYERCVCESARAKVGTVLCPSRPAPLRSRGVFVYFEPYLPFCPSLYSYFELETESLFAPRHVAQGTINVRGKAGPAPSRARRHWDLSYLRPFALSPCSSATCSSLCVR